MSQNENPKPLPKITPGAELFWDYCRGEKLVLPFCNQCAAFFYYPRTWCPSCFNQDLHWKPVSGRGVVHSFSVIHQSPMPSFDADVPYVLAIIELAEGPRMLTNIVNCDVNAVVVDMPVNVVFEKRGNMKVPQFEPAG